MKTGQVDPALKLPQTLALNIRAVLLAGVGAFFEGLVFTPRQVPGRNMADDDPALDELVRQGPRTDVGFLGKAAEQKVALALKPKRTVSAHLAGRRAPRCAIVLHPLDDGSDADTEHLDNSTVRFARQDSSNAALTKIKIEIEIEGACDRC